MRAWNLAKLAPVLLALILTVSLAGCGIKTVYVPVPTCPPPPALAMPLLEVDRLPEKPGTAQALKALGSDHVTLQSTLEQCIIHLDAYRSTPSP